MKDMIFLNWQTFHWLVQLIKQKKYKEALKYIENSKKWPENLGAGKPYDPDERLQDLLSAYCYKKTGDSRDG